MTQFIDLRLKTVRVASVICLTSICLASLLAGPLGAVASPGQELQKGVSVELAATRHAVSMPGADQRGATIVAVTQQGAVFLGTAPVTAHALTVPRGEPIYVKADARAGSAAVFNVLDALQKAGAGKLALLTGQRDDTGVRPAPPMGLEIEVGRTKPAPSSIVVQVLDRAQPLAITINGKAVPETAIPATLSALLRNRRDRVVFAKANGHMPFGDLVRVIDQCRYAGASVVLSGR